MVIKRPLYYIFDRSQHDDLSGPPTDADGKELYYFSRTEKVLKGLRKLVTDDKWLQSMAYYTRFRYETKKKFFCHYLL